MTGRHSDDEDLPRRGRPPGRQPPSRVPPRRPVPGERPGDRPLGDRPPGEPPVTRTPPPRRPPLPPMQPRQPRPVRQPLPPLQPRTGPRPLPPPGPPQPHSQPPPLRPAPVPRAAPQQVNRPAPPPQRPPYRSPFEDSDIDRLPPQYYHEDAEDPGYDDYDGYEGYDEPADEHPVGALLADDEDRAARRRRPAARRRPPRRRSRARRRSSVGRRIYSWVLALALVGGLAAGAWFGARELLGIGYDDFTGSGKKDVIVQIVDGDSTSAIAERLAEAGVVASDTAFVDAAENNTAIRSIRPGYYVVKTRMSGAAAVKAIVADGARVGELQIRSGTQLDDLKDPNGKVIPGVLRRMSRASCAKLNGEDTCVPVKTLRATAAKADLTKLGAPAWLAKSAAKAPADRRLEGLILPGIYDIKPGWDAERMLKEVLTASASQFETVGLPGAAKATRRSPYEVVVIASIIEREAVENDFAKVSRVLYNRMAKDMRLEMDSTINYVLHRPHIRTSAADRAKPGPYNSYRNKTLPPTPISAPSAEALQAALEPDTGKWLYFVKCEKNGLSCFTADFDEHQDNVARAKDRGVW